MCDAILQIVPVCCLWCSRARAQMITYFLEHHLTCTHSVGVQTQSWTASACLARLGSSICLQYSSAWVYFCSFLSRSCTIHFFWRHTNLTNPSGMSHGRNFPQKSMVTCSINSHPMHLALGQGSRNVREDLTCSCSPPHRCSHRSHSTFLLQGKKSPIHSHLCPISVFQSSRNLQAAYPSSEHACCCNSLSSGIHLYLL